MNSSMDRWNTFRRLAGPALFAACALALGTTLAVAQESTAPKATAPAAPAAAPAVPAAGAQAGAPEDSAWVKLCLKNEQTANKQVCLVNHEGLEPNTGRVLVAPPIGLSLASAGSTLLSSKASPEVAAQEIGKRLSIYTRGLIVTVVPPTGTPFPAPVI